MTLFTLPAGYGKRLLLSAVLLSAAVLAYPVGDALAAHRKSHTVEKAVLPQTPPVPDAKPQTEQKQPDSPIPQEDVVVPEDKPGEPAAEAPAAKDIVPVIPEEKPDAGEKKPEGEKPKDQSSSASNEPARVYQNACPALMKGNIQGKLVPPLSDGQCGERSPLSVTAIGTDQPIPLAAAVTTNCAMATELVEWMKDVKRAAMRHFGTEIVSISTGSDYQCRKVNGAEQGRVSEHAFANALDIMSFTFKDKQTTTLETGWQGSAQERGFWRLVHKISCDHFMTVIGPDGDAAHKTNLHLDLGCHGRACEARICQ